MTKSYPKLSIKFNAPHQAHEGTRQFCKKTKPLVLKAMLGVKKKSKKITQKVQSSEDKRDFHTHLRNVFVYERQH